MPVNLDESIRLKWAEVWKAVDKRPKVEQVRLWKELKKLLQQRDDALLPDGTRVGEVQEQKEKG